MYCSPEIRVIRSRRCGIGEMRKTQFWQEGLAVVGRTVVKWTVKAVDFETMDWIHLAQEETVDGLSLTRCSTLGRPHTNCVKTIIKT
jgi:hypothetical protein